MARMYKALKADLAAAQARESARLKALTEQTVKALGDAAQWRHKHDKLLSNYNRLIWLVDKLRLKDTSGCEMMP